MHAAYPAVRHAQEEFPVPDLVTVAQHVVVPVDRMPVHFHVQDRASVQLGTDTPRSRRKGPPYPVAVQSVSPEADPYVQGRQEIRGPAEALEEIRIDIHEPPAADPGDLPEDLLRTAVGPQCRR